MTVLELREKLEKRDATLPVVVYVDSEGWYRKVESVLQEEQRGAIILKLGALVSPNVDL